jgi:hypothetical protein
MTAAEIIDSITSAITNGRNLVWEAPQTIGNGEVAIYLFHSGFGIIAAPHRYSGAEYTVVNSDGVEVDCASTFNNAIDAVAFAETL